MDGYAVRCADLKQVPATLTVVGDVPAGSAATHPVGAGEAMRIMTGAPLPAGADAVVPVELTDQLAGDHPLPTSVVIREAVAQGRHIRRAGENAAVGGRRPQSGDESDTGGCSGRGVDWLFALAGYRPPARGSHRNGSGITGAGRGLGAGRNSGFELPAPGRIGRTVRGRSRSEEHTSE